ncbi:MAG TPA: DNA topoisomerase IV [Saprospirales bacterium]|nr:DNA topoisomerase IV [Saprospirales bacterium]HAY70986.1 DNA topoisomerase IV [Saprospirales bacterium]HRQ28840.1 DNA topoisomerase IV subunit B [Saprospiraceae bacterium]
METIKYTEDNIVSLDWKEHIRLRPGMYIGKLGSGSSPDDGIYILLKEVLDNSIDEYVMGYGKKIEVSIEGNKVIVRDYGRGIPLGKLVECVSQINTGGKYDSRAFKKSVGLNGVGTKAVNALSSYFSVKSIRDGESKSAEFQKGEIVVNSDVIKETQIENGTITTFVPDESIFKEYKFQSEYVRNQLWNYAYLNSGLRIKFNGETMYSKDGLLDFLTSKTDVEKLKYPIIFLKGEDIEVALSHGPSYGEDYYSFVNGQFTTQGGTHLVAFRNAVVKTIRDFYNKNFDSRDIQTGIVGAISIRIEEPVFESQTKTKLGSQTISPEGATLRTFIGNFLQTHLDNYLHKHEDVAKILLDRIKRSEKERKEIDGIKKIAKTRAKAANIHNKKLRDCRIHFNDDKGDAVIKDNSTIFITEGDSASGSITKARDVQTQAVFSLRGKPLNCYGLTKKIVYQNEEFNLLQHALNIEDGLEGLRFNRVVISTDADVDGMHIRLLLLTFFLQFFPELVTHGHLYILETPLFRVRDKQVTYYCYSEKEKAESIRKLKGKPEITRFKGLGEISPNEFGNLIGENMRLEPVKMLGNTKIEDILSYYMGKNTPDRQEFIINNLKYEKEVILESV